MDASGNIVTSDNSTTVTASESSAGTPLKGTVTVTAKNGIVTFTDLAFEKAGAFHLQFTSQPALTSALSNTITVSPASASKLIFVQQPTNASAGATITPAVTVQLKDAFDNDVPHSGTSVTISLSSGTGTLSGTTTRNTNGSGLATFNNLKISSAGDKVLTASANGLTAAVSNTFTISAGAAVSLVIQTQPSPAATAGAPLNPQPVIAVVDAAGNIVTSDNTTTVTVQESSNSTQLQGTVTVKAVNGIVTFSDLSITKAGTYTLKFTSQPALTEVLSNNIVVSAAAPATLVFVQQPTNVSAGASITPPVTVQLRDAFNNDAPVGGVAVTMSLGSGNGTLAGTLTRNTGATGQVSFDNLSINASGQKTLTASSSNLRSATSDLFTVVAGSANQLSFVQQPGNTAAGVVLSPAVTVRIIDANGNTNLVDGTPITLTVASGDSLFGTTTRNTTQGVATFDDIQLRVAGQKTLVASSLGLPAITSSSFSVAAGPAARVVVETAANGAGSLLAAQTIASGSAITAYAITRDAYNNFVGNAAAGSWSLQNISGGVQPGDLSPRGG